MLLNLITVHADCKTFIDGIDGEVRIPDIKNEKYLYVFARREEKVVFAHVKVKDLAEGKEYTTYAVDLNVVWKIRRSINQFLNRAA